VVPAGERRGEHGRSRWCPAKRLVTAEDWAPFAAPGTVPDADGWYPDYLPVPEDLLPDTLTDPTQTPPPSIDDSITAIISAWRYVIADLLDLGIDLWDPAVRARPWPGIRARLFSLLEPDSKSRLRRALTRR
jgi:hypothetical protein